MRSRSVQADFQTPLTHCELVVQVELGLYRFIAHGGPPLEWASGSDAMPLHVRKAVPHRPEAARSPHIAVAIMFGLKAKEGEWAEIPVIKDWARGAVDHGT